MSSVALFVPCYIDQFYPEVAIAALEVLERLGVAVDVPDDAVCCGQPPANAGFEHKTASTLSRFVDVHDRYEHVVVLSGSCALHVRTHASALGGSRAQSGVSVGARVTEFCAFLHDVVGVTAVAQLQCSFPHRAGLHIGCHGLRGMGLATPSEIRGDTRRVNKAQTLLDTVHGLSLAEISRPDECCGFGGTFAVAEPAISVKMGRDRIKDYVNAKVDVLISTDMSCVMHMSGLAHRDRVRLPMLHVAQILAGGKCDATTGK